MVEGMHAFDDRNDVSYGSSRDERNAYVGRQNTRRNRSQRISAVSAKELVVREFPDMPMVVDNLIAQGLTVLAGRPKQGKSWLMLQMGRSVAAGEPFLGHEVQQGSVLYLALEDNDRRLQQRLRQQLQGMDAPELLFVATQCPILSSDGIQSIEDWLDDADQPQLIIIDVFGRIREASSPKDSLYDADYKALTPLKALADTHGIAIIVVHHTRKMAAEDPFDTVSGTTGFTGAADTVMVLHRDTRGTVLYVRGRDVQENEIALSMDQASGNWHLMGVAEEVRRSPERNIILKTLKDAGRPLAPKDVTSLTGSSSANIRQLLMKMVRDGEVMLLSRGLYSLPQFVSESSDHIDNGDYDDTKGFSESALKLDDSCDR